MGSSERSPFARPRARSSALPRWTPPRARIAAVLALALGIALLGCAGGGHGGRVASARAYTAPAALVDVRIDTRHPRPAVPGRFLGLSFELSSLAQVAADGGEGDLVALLRSLGPGVLRFGGVSADTRVAWADARTPRPAWAGSTVDMGDLLLLRRLARLSGWRVLLTVGLAHYDPRAAAREAAAAKRVLGGWLAGIEIGNEPDAYARHHLRSRPWTYARYGAQVAAYRKAIARLAPGIPLAGPGVSGSRIFARWGRDEAVGLRPALLTGHHYPLGCHDAPPPSIERLLSPSIRAAEERSLHRYISVARAHRLAFRMDETNSVSCGGRDGVSDTFGSALWAAGYIARAMAAGAAGINLQSAPGNCRGYSPLCAPDAAHAATGTLRAQPQWYALLLTRSLAGTRPLPTRVASSRPVNTTATAFLAPDGTLRLLAVDDEPAGAGPLALAAHVGARYRAASALVLSAPSPAATSGVLLGGSAVAADGSWQAPARLPQASVRGGILTTTVAPGQAQLLTLTR